MAPFLVQCDPNPSSDPTFNEPSPRRQFRPRGTEPQHSEPSVVLDKASPGLLFHHLQLSSSRVCLCVRKLPTDMTDMTDDIFGLRARLG